MGKFDLGFMTEQPAAVDGPKEDTGEKVENVGTPHRVRVAVGETELYVENADGWTPVTDGTVMEELRARLDEAKAAQTGMVFLMRDTGSARLPTVGISKRTRSAYVAMIDSASRKHKTYKGTPVSQATFDTIVAAVWKQP